MRDIKRENDDKLNSFPENFSHDDTYISDWEAAADNVYSRRQCLYVPSCHWFQIWAEIITYNCNM